MNLNMHAHDINISEVLANLLFILSSKRVLDLNYTDEGIKCYFKAAFTFWIGLRILGSVNPRIGSVE